MNRQVKLGLLIFAAGWGLSKIDEMTASKTDPSLGGAIFGTAGPLKNIPKLPSFLEYAGAAIAALGLINKVAA